MLMYKITVLESIFTDYIPHLLTYCSMLKWSLEYVQKQKYKQFNVDYV